MFCCVGVLLERQPGRQEVVSWQVEEVKHFHHTPFPLPLPPPQLEMITDLLGTPSLEDVCHVTSHLAVKSLLSKAKPCALGKLYALSPTTSHGAVHLLSQIGRAHV